MKVVGQTSENTVHQENANATSGGLPYPDVRTRKGCICGSLTYCIFSGLWPKIPHNFHQNRKPLDKYTWKSYIIQYISML